MPKRVNISYYLSYVYEFYFQFMRVFYHDFALFFRTFLLYLPSYTRKTEREVDFILLSNISE